MKAFLTVLTARYHLAHFSNKPHKFKRRTVLYNLFCSHIILKTQVYTLQTHKHTHTSTCHFLQTYHPIKAGPCNFGSREDCIPHFLKTVQYISCILQVFVNCSAIFLGQTPACLTSCAVWYCFTIMTKEVGEVLARCNMISNQTI